MRLKIHSLLILLFTVSGSMLILAQNKEFDLLKMKQIKQYKSTQIENGLTLLQQNSRDTNSFFIRVYTSLPQFVPKINRNILEIDNILRKSPSYKLPVGWTKETLEKLKIRLSKDEYGFYASCPRNRLDTTFHFLAALMQSPTSCDQEIEAAKARLISQNDSLEKSPSDKIDRITKSIIYGKDHPILKHFNATEINAIKVEDYIEFYEKYYKPNNSYMLVIGNIYLDSLKVLAKKAFGSWKKKDIPQADYKLIPIEEPKIVFFDTIPSGNTEIKILFPFALHPFTFDSEKAELLSLLYQEILAEKLINQKKIATSIHARFESDKITANYQLNVMIKGDSLVPVIQAIIETISELNAGKFPSALLEKAKQKIISNFKNYKTDNPTLSALIIQTERNNLPKEYYADFVDEIEKTGVQGIQNYTAKYLNYNTALFQIPGKWYQSLNDFIILSKNFRIELYELGGNLSKVIPRGFNGFSVIDRYINAIGGEQNIRKIKEVNINYGAIYNLDSTDQFFVEGIMLHQAENKYYSESYIIRPRLDTLLLEQEIYNGQVGVDSTMQERKYLHGEDLELLRYKSPFVPEMYYKSWLFNANLIKADTLNGKYVWIVSIENPVKQRMLDFYDVDKGLRYKRIVQDNRYFNKRIIHYSDYRTEGPNLILYPYFKVIQAPNATIRMKIREVSYDLKSSRKIFEIN